MHRGWAEARRIARDAVKPLEAVELPLAEALGRALASPVRALTAMPAYDNSAMDGYAVAGPGPWTVVGAVRAGGEPYPGVLAPGTAIEIATGAPVPPGTQAVLPVEYAVHSGRRVAGEVASGKHVRRRGEDCPEGEELLATSTTVTAAVLGAAAAAGHDTLLVHRRPRVSVVVTGDEVQTSGVPAPGRVRDAIGPMLPGLLAEAGAEEHGLVQPADQPTALTAALTEGDADVVVVCGATSKGPADHLRGVLRALLADVRVDGVACRPGHPQLLAVLPDGRCVTGLPGNPFAALAAGLTLLSPLLLRLGGHRAPPPATARAGAALPVHERDTRLVPVAWSGRSVTPVGHDRPGSLWGAALADALAVVPPGFAGGDLELLPLPGGRR
ncbi:molybdopterin molybdotransferase MoeA [Amycolatopsis sp. FDAARGOS 1241]|uniref:molybdopterin molybdotransferase MoeA n=1 Tax=Amycolatopsis sp. FDAARGOS 1241 TaxID=2778070 RepID=UPI00194F7835|nr:molybdopterin molybdotransferase MoeA [Amycolatopsis sp. FDAARGOS 1241]QRP49852.1 molybdopterin molybdotransferase MoeA [Amycolatopsis sp. FDAARGOS 1241]